MCACAVRDNFAIYLDGGSNPNVNISVAKQLIPILCCADASANNRVNTLENPAHQVECAGK